MPVENQHYVPRFILKKFSSGKKPKIWAFDKSNDKVFQTNIKNIASEKGFYEFEIPEAKSSEKVSMEKHLSSVETMASSAFKKICSNKNLKDLSKEHGSIMMLFVTVQFVRTKEYRERFLELGETIKEKVKQIGATNEQIADLIGNDKENETFIGLSAFSNINHFLPQFADKAWLLFETTMDAPFHISDNPVVLHNEIDHSPYGSLGLSVRGIEIYFPISSTLCLAIYCPSIADKIMESAERIEKFNMPILDDEMESIANLAHGLRNGTSISINAKHVRMLNSLQVTFSTRYVYNENGNFDLVKEMISNNNAYRTALRATTN